MQTISNANHVHTLTNDEDVGDTGGEDTVQRVLDVDDFETTNVTFTVNDDTNTTNVTTASDHADVAGVELDKVGDLVVLQVEADGVVSLDQRIGVADSATIVGDDVGDTLLANHNLLDAAKLVLGLLIGDAMDGEATFNVIDETEVLTSLFNGNNIYHS